MTDDTISKIKEAHRDFKDKLNGILDKKKQLLKTYRLKLEEEKIQELRGTLNNLHR